MKTVIYGCALLLAILGLSNSSMATATTAATPSTQTTASSKPQKTVWYKSKPFTITLGVLGVAAIALVAFAVGHAAGKQFGWDMGYKDVKRRILNGRKGERGWGVFRDKFPACASNLFRFIQDNPAGILSPDDREQASPGMMSDCPFLMPWICERNGYNAMKDV